MSSYETISLLLSLAGSIGVIVSLWLLYRQTGIFNRQLMVGVTQSMSDYTLEISRLFLQNPDLRPYFFEGKTIEENDPNYLRAEAVAEVILDIFWTLSSESKRIQGSEFGSEEVRSQWRTYVGDCFANSPILTSFLKKRQGWYGSELVKQMEEGLARARQQKA